MATATKTRRKAGTIEAAAGEILRAVKRAKALARGIENVRLGYDHEHKLGYAETCHMGAAARVFFACEAERQGFDVIVPTKAIEGALKKKPGSVLQGRVEDDKLILQAVGAKRTWTVAANEPGIIAGWTTKPPFLRAEAGAFWTTVKCIGVFASRDDARPHLNGIRFEKDGDGKLWAIATDSYRLGVLPIPGKVSASKFGDALTIPSDTLKRATLGLDHKQFADSGVELARLGGDKAVVMRRFGEWWQMPIVEGNYPNWPALFPTDKPKVIVEVDGDTLLDVADAAVAAIGENVSTYSQPKALRVAFYAAEMKCESYGEGVSKFEEAIKAKITYAKGWKGKRPLVVGFNPAFIYDMANAILGETITIELTEPEKPSVFRAGEQRAVLMPVRLMDAPKADG